MELKILTAGPAFHSMFAQWLALGVQSGIWVDFCRTGAGDCWGGRCSGSIRGEEIPGTDPQFSWLLGPCFYHAIASFVHLLFVLFWSVGTFRNCFNNLFRPGAVAINGLSVTREVHIVSLKTRKLFLISIVCSAFLFLLNFSVGVEDLILRWHTGKSKTPLHLEASSWILALAWLILTIASNSTRKRKADRIPPLVRIWWTASFVLSSLSLLPNFLLFQSTDELTSEAWLETLSILVTAFLCVMALLGKTGITILKDESGSLKEPLLDEAAAQEHRESSQGPGVSPYATAGFFSLLSISWLNSLFATGFRKRLELEDIPLLVPRDKSEYNYGKLKASWAKQTEKDPTKPPSLRLALIKSFWKEEIWVIFLAATIVVASYVGPLLIDDFVEYLAGRRRFAHEGFFLILAFFLAQIVNSAAVPAWWLAMQTLGLHLRSSLTAFVFRKGLGLSSRARQGHTTGEIINIVSVDVNRVGEASWYFHEVVVLPFQLVLALLILYKVIGIATLATLVASAIVMVSNMPLAKIQDIYQEKWMAATDERMKALTESLRSMQVLKFQAWETKYLSKIEALRKTEYHRLRGALYTNSAITFVFWASPLFVSVASFGTCVLLGTPLTAGRILSALATFRVLQEPITQIPDALSMMSMTKVSMGRLGKYMLEEELQEDAVIHAPSPRPDEAGMAIEVDGGEFRWDPAVQTPTLHNVNFRAEKGQRVAICGSVGSGKSTLLSTILGEISKTAGTVKVFGTTAYVAQTAWIQSGTIEQNILFGASMDRQRYLEALRVCALGKDIGMFDFGDQTVIGERGINMSGGQKQRIQLARAVYQNADIYLLDDPFSAVDAHTGSDLFQKCILEALGTKTVLYVTHQVEFLPAADLILVMRDGKIIQSGKYDDLLQAGTDFNTLVDAHKESIDFISSGTSTKEIEEDDEFLGEDDEFLGEEGEDLTKLIRQLSKTNSKKEKAEDNVVPNVEKRQLVEDELRAVGNTSFSVYFTYLTAVYKGSMIPVIVLAQLGFQGLQIASNYWMAWSTPATAGEPQRVDNKTLIFVYCLFALGSALFVTAVALLTTTVELLTGQKFFLNMLRSIFRAPMSFFDSTPTGRILSRASTDQNTIDCESLNMFTGYVMETVRLVGVAFVMSQITWKVFLLFLPACISCLFIQRYYIKTARELQRLNGINKSPIIHHYGEAIAGAVTIRGFGRAQQFLETLFELSDRWGRVSFHSFSGLQWLLFRIEMLSNCVFTFALLYAVTFLGGMDPGVAGLAVTYGLQLSTIQTAWIWKLGGMENRIICVERVLQYTRLQSEGALLIEDSRPPTEWPKDGSIELHDLKVRYNDHSPYVLHGLTCTFQGGHKIGIVGRTGSGKSTLIQTLFRMVEPTGGRIVIDGIDISTIGLHDLRNKLSIIPQDPTLFEGTIRANLDPLQQYSDAEIWESLDKCQLGDVLRAKEQKLDSPVHEQGENWSVGQRQLVCLGRALLKSTTILVLDEATASVDTVTDGVIQRTIRAEFGDRTVITVAHRIPTVIDSDRVLVLSDGRVAEYDLPSKLLKRRDSLFYKLVSEYSSRSKSVNNLTDLS